MGSDNNSNFSTKDGTGTSTAGLVGRGQDHYRLGSLRGMVPGRKRPESSRVEPPPGTPVPMAEAVTPVDPSIFGLEALGLPEPLREVLVELGYPTSNELVQTSAEELMAEHAIGSARLAIIQDALASKGLALRED